jgi:hypothetical protein
MSLSGDSRAEFCPEGINLFSQLGHASGVVHDHVSRTPAIFSTDLSGNPGLGFSASESVAHHQPLDLSFMISIDSDHNIEVLLLTGLDQQRNNVNHDCGGIRGPFQLGGPGTYGWVHNLLEISACQRISEDDLGQPRSVELPVGDYLRAETLDDRGERWGTRLDYFACQHIGIDDHCTALCQLGGDETFSRPDAASQTDPHHAQQPKQLGLPAGPTGRRGSNQLPPVSF